MKNTHLLGILAVGLLCGPALAEPNIIILYADDLGFADLGCHGCKDIRTPNIDSLAEQGVRFTNYYSAAPICSPSRAALLTGRYPIRAGMAGNASSNPGDAGMPSEQVTIAELAGTRGYATGVVGKWHLGFSHDTQPNAQGFDVFFGHHAGCIDYYSRMFYWQGAPHHDLYRNRQEIHEEGRYMTDLITREAIRFIEGRKSGPFLLYVPYNAPHYPMQAPEPFRTMYADLPPERAVYAAMVTAMDESIGQIMEAVRQAGKAADTFVFFASDNGATTEIRGNGKGGSNAPFRGHKFSLFDGGIHLPAIVSWPARLPRGQTRDQVVCGIDLLPTIVEIINAGLPADRKIDGLSWLNLLSDSQAAGHDTLFWDCLGQQAVRQGRWKLVLNALDTAEDDQRPRLKGPDAVFLADLQTDPGEMRNLRSDHPQIVERLKRLLAAWQADLESDKATR